MLNKPPPYCGTLRTPSVYTVSPSPYCQIPLAHTAFIHTFGLEHPSVLSNATYHFWFIPPPNNRYYIIIKYYIDTPNSNGFVESIQ